MNIAECKVRAASRSAQDIVVLGSLLRGTDNVLHRHASNGDAIRRNASWATVQVVLLDVNAVVGDVVDDDVLVGDTA